MPEDYGEFFLIVKDFLLFKNDSIKAELLEVDIFFLAWKIFLLKKLEIEKTKTS